MNTKIAHKSEKIDILEDTEKVSKAINQFINGDVDKNNNSNTSTLKNGTGKQFHDRRDVITALTNLQLTYKPQFNDDQTSFRTDSFKHALLNSMAKLGNTSMSKSLNAIDGRTIDFIEMLFSAFLCNENISATVKSLLLELQVPLIKVAMLDPQFFQNSKHTARQMLDTVAHLGIGIDNSDNTLYKTIKLIIEQLQSTFDQNLSSFNTSLTALNRLLKIENEKTGKQEEETQRSIFKEHARQIVLNELQKYTYKKTIKKELKSLILKQWAALMFQRFIKYGKDSEQWYEIITLLKHLIYSMQPIKSAEQWTFLNSESAVLINDIKAQLETTKLSPGSIDASIDALKETHTDLLESSEYYQEQPDYSLSEKSLNEIIEEASEEIPENDEEEPPHIQISRLPHNVKQGVWFEIFNGEDKAKRRAKLSVILFDEAKLVFVDRLGNKIIEKYANEFANEIDSEKSKIISDHSIFNQALNQIINSIG